MIERIIFDWKRTLYNPDEGELLPGALTVLRTLNKRGLDLFLIGRGEGDRAYIPEDSPETTLVVGDRAQQEIALAKSLGATAIWLRAGRFQDELPLPHLPPPNEIITDIGQLLDSPLLRTIE